MELKVIKTGSVGNCYILKSDSGEILLLDCGVPVQSIKVAVDFQVSQIKGCIVSHVHSDHISPKTAESLQLMGIPIWKAYEGDKKHTFFGGFKVISFDVEHDGTPNKGFVINADGKILLYITDAEYVKYSFKSMSPDAILIECNYQADYVDMELEHIAHIFRGHMELQTCIDFLRANQTDDLKNVILCHLSRNHADVDECREAVQNALGNKVTVNVAEKGKTFYV